MPQAASHTVIEAQYSAAGSRKRKHPALAKPKTVLVPDVAGRIDVAVSRMVERVIANSGNPYLQAVYQAYGDEVNGMIAGLLAPKTKSGKPRAIRRMRVEI